MKLTQAQFDAIVRKLNLTAIPTLVNTSPEYLMEAAQQEEGFIADLVCPPVQVAHRFNQFLKWKIGAGGLMRANGALRAPGATFAQTTRQATWSQYLTQERALEGKVPLEQQEEAENFGYDNISMEAKLVQRELLTDKEIRVANLTQNPAYWQTTNATVAYTPGNQNTADFPKDVLTALRKFPKYGIRRGANWLVITDDLYDYNRLAPKTQDFLRGVLAENSNIMWNDKLTMGTNVTNSLKTLFGLAGVLISDAYYVPGPKNNTEPKPDNPGASLNLPGFDGSIEAVDSQRIWNNDHFWIGEIQGGSPKLGGAMREFFYNGEGQGVYAAYQYLQNETRSVKVQVSGETQEQIINPYSGQLIKTNYSAT